MYSLEIRSAALGSQNLQDSLLNSLLAGKLGREWLAPDSLLRHTVWAEEKLGGIPTRITRNRHYTPRFGLKPHRRECPIESLRAGFPSLLSGGHTRGPVFETPSGECNAIS